MIRYSDVVLMAAEAACEMGGEAMIEEALDYLEQVRARARGTNTNVLPKVTTTNQLELCKAIHHERHVELALEYADRIIGIRAGKIVYDGPSKQVDQAVLDTIYGEDIASEAAV